MSSQVPTRKLGKNGPQVTALGIGLMGLSIAYGKPKPDADRMKFLDYIYDAGERFWDSSDVYGDSEDLLGRWFKQNPGKRDSIFLASKFGIYLNPDGTRSARNDPEYVRQACDKSLRRLGIDHIDLYYCHRIDPQTPIEQTVQAMVELKQQGKIKHLGLSECSAETVRRACKVDHIDAVQIEYSPFTMDIENPKVGLLATCRELGVATVAYSPIGRGFLSGHIRSPDDFEPGDFRSHAPRFSKENFHKNLELVDTLKEVADAKGCTAAQLTLAFLLAQGEDIIPIPGTTNIKNFEENMASLKLQISGEDEERIRKAISNAEVRGGRYPESFAMSLFADTVPLKGSKV